MMMTPQGKIINAWIEFSYVKTVFMKIMINKEVEFCAVQIWKKNKIFVNQEFCFLLNYLIKIHNLYLFLYDNIRKLFSMIHIIDMIELYSWK